MWLTVKTTTYSIVYKNDTISLEFLHTLCTVHRFLYHFLINPFTHPLFHSSYNTLLPGAKSNTIVLACPSQDVHIWKLCIIELCIFLHLYSIVFFRLFCIYGLCNMYYVLCIKLCILRTLYFCSLVQYYISGLFWQTIAAVKMMWLSD